MNKTKFFRLRTWLYLTVAVCTALGLSACTAVSYYGQAVKGHLALMHARQPIEEVLSNPDTDPALRDSLRTLLDAREFAVNRLGLPDNDSYSTFVQTGRRAVTWNVVAVAEFSLQPETWCFPVAGCVSYRGYFDRADADAYAAEMTGAGFDVTVGGASAYSTLGWFDDPVLDTMLRGSDIRYVGTLFHELAHQVLYVRDDSQFNEAFATFVEQKGIHYWLAERGQSDRIAAYDASKRRMEGFLKLLQQTREALVELYATSAPVPDMRVSKAAVFAQMRENYAQLKASWDGYSGYDGWFSREINNARLVSIATYRRFVPAFEAMYIEAGEDLKRFYDVAAITAELPFEQRRERLNAYMAALRATN